MRPVCLALVLLSVVGGGHAGVVWSEGVDSVIAVTSDMKYTLTWSGMEMEGSWGGLTPKNYSTTSGADRLGEYREVLFDDACAIRYHVRSDAFTFTRWNTTRGETAFPSFSIPNTTGLGCIGWSRRPMLPGSAGDVAKCPTDGPIVLFRNSTQVEKNALVLSARDNFTANFPVVRSGMISVTSTASHPVGTSLSSVLLTRRTLTRATRAYGSFLRRLYQTTRSRSYGTTRLSYWNDNSAGYNFWASSWNMSRWGVPEKIFQQLRESYAELGVTMGAWEVDSNFAYEAKASWGWCWKDFLSWNTTLYPNGGRLSELLGGLPMTFYIDEFCKDNVHRATGKYKWLDTTWGIAGNTAALIHPDDAYALYHDLLAAAKEWNMQMLFTDFLSPRGNAVTSAMNNTFGAEARWLGGMTQAAQDLGMEVQYCMASAHQALESLKYPAVTNARANGDGGMAEKDLVYSSLLSGVLGIGWSKDNLRLGGCSNPPCICPFGHAALQTHLAVLSLGPVGLADQLTGPVGGAKVSVDTNATLARATSAANGVLLQPSYPLTPLDDLLAHRNGLSPTGGHVWGTYTAIGKYVWWTVLGFTVSPSSTGPPATYTVRGEHLATMVDSPSTNFADIPQGTFVSNPTELTGQHVVWRKSESTARAFNSDGVEVRLESNTADPDVLVVAPVINGVAVLGEVGKVCSISTYRFTDIAPATPSSVSVTLRGTVGEEVHVAYSSSTDRETRTASVTIPSAGTATLHIP